MTSHTHQNLLGICLLTGCCAWFWGLANRNTLPTVRRCHWGGWIESISLFIEWLVPWFLCSDEDSHGDGDFPKTTSSKPDTVSPTKSATEQKSCPTSQEWHENCHWEHSNVSICLLSFTVTDLDSDTHLQSHRIRICIRLKASFQTLGLSTT